jgi:hypothetical protein
VNDAAAAASYRLGMKSMRTGGVMNSRHLRRLSIALGLVLTVSALVAPSANAKMQKIYSDRGVTLVQVSSEPSPNFAYSDRGVTPITPSKPNLACSSQGCSLISPPQGGPSPVSNISDEPSNFDWGRIGFIVSLALLGLLLLGGGAMLAGKHNRRRRLAAA